MEWLEIFQIGWAVNIVTFFVSIFIQMILHIPYDTNTTMKMKRINTFVTNQPSDKKLKIFGTDLIVYFFPFARLLSFSWFMVLYYQFRKVNKNSSYTDFVEEYFIKLFN